MQKIAFIGYYKAFCYEDIGGTNSIVRRLSNYMSKSMEIFHLTYDVDSIESSSSINGIKQHNFVSLKSMLLFAYKNKITNLMIIYIRPIDYLRLVIFRIFNRSIVFHFLITGLSSSTFKATVSKFIIKRITNGKIFCVSKKLTTAFKDCGSRVAHIMPPVNDSFFTDGSLRDKKSNKKIRIAFMGRIDAGKGADIAINFFEKNNLSTEKFEFYLYGYPHESDPRSMEMHHKLLYEDSRTNYVQSPVWGGYSPKVDKFLANLIDEVDLFYLPYRTINSTIDTPLVPLEILARSGIFLTTDFQQLRDITPDRRFIVSIKEISNMSLIEERILELTNKDYVPKNDNLLEELDFRTSSIAAFLGNKCFETE
tara:strand:+ start:201 stop:1301 length:1101 start_codon:yes stop_codon:yes gene_type:complete